MLGGWGNKNKKSFALQTINCKEDPFFYSFKKKDEKCYKTCVLSLKKNI